MDSRLSTVVIYCERIYPAEINAYKNIVRNRTKFTINDIWNNNRPQRSLSTTSFNSQGVLATTQSVWPLDPNLNFISEAPLLTDRLDGSGELQNVYSRYGTAGVTGAPTAGNNITASALYASRVPAGFNTKMQAVYGGATAWETPTESGRYPYETYEYWIHKMRVSGKDYSIVPEFRISELMNKYVTELGDNFLADIDEVFTLTGAALDSNDSSFFTTYTNADFMKYFEVVDDMLNAQRSGDLKIEREKVSLKCSAFLKFLPYKGFYPAERVLELASLFSQSYGDHVSSSYPAAYRAMLEPLMSPGILNNTVKSGVAVGSWITTSVSMSRTLAAGLDGTDISASLQGVNSAATELPEGVICFGSGSLLSASTDPFTNMYNFQRIPFEALYRPDAYLISNTITGSHIYDSGVGTASLARNNAGESIVNRASWDGTGNKLYRLAIDNFLCETSNFFMDDMANFVSKPELNFSEEVREGDKYALTFHFNRTLGVSTSTAGADADADRTRFEMYDRASSFGAPFVLNEGSTTGIASALEFTASLAPHLPAYYYGTSSVTILTTSSYTGQPTLGELFGNAEFIYNRSLEHGHYDEAAIGYWFAQQVSESINLTEVIQDGTSQRWAIQSKFETPVLNFADVSVQTPAAAEIKLKHDCAATITSKGMWHQSGSLPKNDEGIFISITTPPIVTSPTYGRVVNPLSLANLVGFEEGVIKNVGNVRTSNKLEEAVIIVPYIATRGRRQFFKFPRKRPPAYNNLVRAMQKYVFPPKFDFTRFSRTVKPILMYVFEFNIDITQEDIANMWQNVTPGYIDAVCQVPMRWNRVDT